MNIIFVASLKGYTTAVSLIKSFQFLKHNVTILSDLDSEYIQNVDIVNINFNISDYITNSNLEPDLVFFCEGGSMKLFPQGLEKLTCKTAWYGIDTHMDFAKHLEIAHFFDLTFLAQKQYIEKFLQKGLKNTFWLPLGYDIYMSPNEKFERIYDIAYVGSNNKNLHPVRFELIEKLKKEFPNSYFGVANGKDMYKIYSQAKLVFNKSINNDINMRYFEALGNGAMLLTDKITDNGVDELFENNKHYLEYDNFNIINVASDFLKSKLDHSASLNEFILQNHTYNHRVTYILENLSNCVKTPISRNYIDYAKVYLLLENLTGFLICLQLIFKNDVIKLNNKRRIMFFPFLFLLQVTNYMLKTLRR